MGSRLWCLRSSSSTCEFGSNLERHQRLWGKMIVSVYSSRSGTCRVPTVDPSETTEQAAKGSKSTQPGLGPSIRVLQRIERARWWSFPFYILLGWLFLYYRLELRFLFHLRQNRSIGLCMQGLVLQGSCSGRYIQLLTHRC